MSFPVFHGIKLAANAEIQNAVFEKLTTAAINALTGAQLAEGRVVFDTTDQVIKYIKSDGSIEQGATKTVTDALQTLVDTINGDSSTTGSFRKAIADVVGAAPEALDTLVEIATALNDDANLATTLTNLINAIDARVTALEATAPNQTEVDAIETAVGLNTDGTYASPSGTNYIDSTTSVANALTTLDTAIQTAASNATIPAYRTTTTTAATSHTITHNLNSNYVEVVVWTKHSDNLYYKDIVEIKEVDANNVTVSLTESLNIKVIVQDLS